MAYTYDNENNLIKLPGEKKEPTRKPNALPPKTTQIIKAKSGGPVKPVVRKENLDERIQRMVYQYDGNKNDRPPPHYNNPNIIDEENWKQPPKKFSSNDPSSYPSDRDQRQRLSSWDLIVQSAKGNPSEMREVREILRKHHKSNPGSLTDNELKMIGQYKPKKLETITPVVETPKPIINEPVVPQKTADQIVKELADQRLKREQEAYDKEYGVGGIPKILRPE